MSTPYLNPLDVLGLADTPLAEITPPLILKNKRRFLAEMEVGDYEEFDVAGVPFVPSDLERAVEELKEPEMLAAQHFAARHLSVVDFLIAGKLPPEEEIEFFGHEDLRPVVNRYFAPLYNRAFLRAAQYADDEALLKLQSLALQTRLPDTELYEDTYQYVSREVGRTVRAVNDKLAGGKSEDVEQFSSSKIPEKNLPPALMSSLPPYFADQINKLADALMEYLGRRGKKEQGYLLELIDYMGDLPHLKPETDEEVKRLLPGVIKAKQNGMRIGQRKTPSRSAKSILRLVVNIIVVLVLLARLGSCMAR